MDTPKPGPALAETVTEVQAHFPDDAALQGALGRLALAGFDRADFSLPEEHQAALATTPNEGAATPVDQIDKSQLRTMGTSMAAYAGAVAAVGVTLATGGAAGVAIAAAAAAGAGGALVANSVGRAADQLHTEGRDELGAEGKLVLAVRTTTSAQVEEATRIMQEAGATTVDTVERGADVIKVGVSAASWTGA